MTFPEIFDVVISFDTTGSMYRCLENVKTNMKNLIRKLQTNIPGLYVGVIAHGDYDTDHTYIIKHEDLTDNVRKLCKFTEEAKGTRGGKTSKSTMDEAYELALHYSRMKISWRKNSNRILVLIGDCCPHEKDFHMNTDHIDWNYEIDQLREMDVKIYAVQCMGRSESDAFYQKIASYTFGHHVRLDDFSQIENVLISICHREAGLEELQEQHTSKRNTQSDADYISEEEQGENDRQSSLQKEKQSDEETFSSLEMQCDICEQHKPPDEFPQDPVSEFCEHYPGVCFRCVVDSVLTHKKCPQPDCKVEVDESSERVKFCQAALDRMFIDYSKVFEENRQKMLSSKGNVIALFSISGDTVWVDYSPERTVPEIMKEVEEQTKIKMSNQKILFKDQRLKPYKSATKPYLLSDYGIKQHEALTLIVPLFCIPEDLDHVVFDLSWEFPKQNPDFLDASCLAFNDQEFIHVIDWNHPENDYYLKGAVKHTQAITYGRREGHQTIKVSLKALPKYVSCLFFILSSWKSPDLSAFSKPCLKFYPESQPENNLCETTFSHALKSQAVIMCSVVRQGERWLIFDHDEDSCVNGNSKRYNPIRKRIVELIAKDQ